MRHTGSSIIIHNAAGEVLLFLRDDNPAIACPGMWDLPGGHVEPGESPYECIVREMQEEIETDVENARLFRSYDFPDRDEHVFELQLELDPAATILHEGQELRWFSRAATGSFELAYGFNRVLDDWFSARRG